MIKIENKKIILQIIPAMEMGGAEIGTLEISSYMKKKGWNVIVTSSGGSLVEKLNFRKINHIKLPLNSKNPLIIFFNIYRILFKFNIFGKFSVSFKLRSVAINGVFN